MNKREIEKLRRQRRALDEKIFAEDQIRADKHNAKLVGKCFLYMNSYGGSYGEPWPLYQKVLSAEEGGVTLFQFETDCDGKITIEPACRRFGIATLGESISENEFDAAYHELCELLLAHRKETDNG